MDYFVGSSNQHSIAHAYLGYFLPTYHLLTCFRTRLSGCRFSSMFAATIFELSEADAELQRTFKSSLRTQLRLSHLPCSTHWLSALFHIFQAAADVAQSRGKRLGRRQGDQRRARGNILGADRQRATTLSLTMAYQLIIPNALKKHECSERATPKGAGMNVGKYHCIRHRSTLA